MNLRTAILQASAEAFGMTVDDMLKQVRTTRRVCARYAAITIARELIPFLSNRELAEMVGLTDHASAIYGRKRAAALCETDPAFASALHTAREAVKRNRKS
jgi:chromosomal replication initiation ATPase DnaA